MQTVKLIIDIFLLLGYLATCLGVALVVEPDVRSTWSKVFWGIVIVIFSPFIVMIMFISERSEKVKNFTYGDDDED
jgi:hypothetical protein